MLNCGNERGPAGIDRKEKVEEGVKEEEGADERKEEIERGRTGR